MSIDKLTSTEQRDIYIQAGLEAIPYIGGSISTLYFGRKQELRFRRIEEFYRRIAAEFKGEALNLSNIDQQKLVALIETIHDNVEKEINDEKIDYFKNCFINTICEYEFQYEKRKFFVKCLGDLEGGEVV